MKKLFIFMMILMAACTARQDETNEPAATDISNMANPASVYCEENGNTLEIHAAVDGSQSGVCVFPDGRSCDEWAYFRGECGPGLQEIVDWWGVIKHTEPGAQFDDYFERQDSGQTQSFGVNAMDPEVKSQIEALRDSGKIVHLYGTLASDVPDYNGSQIQVDRIEVEE